MTNRNHFNENFKKIRVTGNILIWSYLHLVYFILPVYNFEKKSQEFFLNFQIWKLKIAKLCRLFLHRELFLSDIIAKLYSICLCCLSSSLISLMVHRSQERRSTFISLQPPKQKTKH